MFSDSLGQAVVPLKLKRWLLCRESIAVPIRVPENGQTSIFPFMRPYTAFDDGDKKFTGLAF